MQVHSIHKKGDKEINEDACVIREDAHIYAAIDGATGLNGVPGHIASQAVRNELQTSSSENTLYETIQAANTTLRKKNRLYYQEHIGPAADFESIDKNQRSSTGLAAIKIDQQNMDLHYVHAADCMLFLQYENGDIRKLTYDLVQYLDQIAIDELAALRSADPAMPLVQAREAIKPILLHNRSKLNADDGYGIIDGSAVAMKHLDYGKVSLKRATKILLLSDGMLLPVSHSETNAWEQTAEIAFSKGLEPLLEIIENRENQDPECIEFPRLKQRDDKTAILLEL